MEAETQPIFDVLSFGLNSGVLSLSASVSAAESFLKSTSQYSSFAQTTTVASIYQAVTRPASQLSFTQSFINAVSTLPVEYNQKVYNHAFGTHYVQSAYFGDIGVMESGVNSEFSTSPPPKTVLGSKLIYQL